MSLEAHYHVDVLVGPKLDYRKGPVLIHKDHGTNRDRDRYLLVDDFGVLSSVEFSPTILPLEEALKLVARLLRRKWGPPIFPFWHSAPWGRLGYSEPPNRLYIFPARLKREWAAWQELNEIGEDGEPVRLEP